MKSYGCSCGNRLFFDNTICLSCGKDVGFCPACMGITSLLPQPDGLFKCGHPDCGVNLSKCRNDIEYQVCNRCVRVPIEKIPDVAAVPPLCDCCRFNRTIPDLSIAGNLQKWAVLEAAKRRLFYDLDLLKLPYGDASENVDPPLTFEFMGNVLSANSRWHSLNQAENVYTGHDNGTITINIIEADPVEREKARVSLGEPQRTLLGHFRHEIGHYYWDLLVKKKSEPAFIAVFGDHNSPTYDEALEKYYQVGPPADWPESYISAYATMHPWEDFAETWAMYLQLTSEIDTAVNVGFLKPGSLQPADLPAMVLESQKLSLALNEMNRSLGLMDAMPKPIVAPVIEKLKFIHQLNLSTGLVRKSAL